MAALAVGVAVLVSSGAMQTSAAESDNGLSRPVPSEQFEHARRGEAVSVATPPTTPAPAPTPAPPPPPQLSELDQMARDVIRLTNIERQAHGVAPLTMHPLLNVAADAHARDVATRECKAGVLSHTGSDGSRAVDRILRTGLDISRWGENIGCGQRTPEAIVQGWMASPGHRANLLNPLLTQIGVDVEKSAAGHFYWVQDLATLR